MAEFKKALALVLRNEGGYVNDPDDAGGETYKGIARNRNPSWSGWIRVDVLKSGRGFPENLNSDNALQAAVSELYEVKYWHRVQGDDIESQDVAQSIFDFAVNAGVVASSKLAQYVCGAIVDGVIGQQTLGQLNAMSPAAFLTRFSLSKIARYVQICEKNPKMRKYFFGWTRRVLEGV